MTVESFCEDFDRRSNRIRILEGNNHILNCILRYHHTKKAAFLFCCRNIQSCYHLFKFIYNAINFHCFTHIVIWCIVTLYVKKFLRLQLLQYQRDRSPWIISNINGNGKRCVFQLKERLEIRRILQCIIYDGLYNTIHRTLLNSIISKDWKKISAYIWLQILLKCFHFLESFFFSAECVLIIDSVRKIRLINAMRYHLLVSNLWIFSCELKWLL